MVKQNHLAVLSSLLVLALAAVTLAGCTSTGDTSTATTAAPSGMPAGGPPAGGAPGGGGSADTSAVNTKHLDVAYADQSEAQKLDIYVPNEGTGPFPVIISVHGGAFMMGDKADGQLTPMLAGLDRGYAVVGVNYRLSSAYRILAIEDDAPVAEGLVESLCTQGFDVHWEATAASGLAWATEHAPHLVLLDVRLPDGNGFDVLRQMRARSLRQPVLMLTVQAEEIDRVLGLELGADDYLAKPFVIRELLARVRSLLRRSYGEFSSAESAVLYAGDLVVDLGRAAVSRDGTELQLTPMEYRMLVYMGRHPGQVLSRAQLIENIWGSAGDFHDENAVSVQIRRLRQKIEADPGDPQIVLTVPGLGYRLRG